jgi:hypothetical protein
MGQTQTIDGMQTGTTRYEIVRDNNDERGRQGAKADGRTDGRSVRINRGLTGAKEERVVRLDGRNAERNPKRQRNREREKSCRRFRI